MTPAMRLYGVGTANRGHPTEKTDLQRKHGA
jgi:hypothetical protein